MRRASGAGAGLIRADWNLSYSTLTNLETIAIAMLGVGLGLVWLLRFLQRTRPEMTIARPIAVGYGLRLTAIAGVSATGIGTQLRGGDEIGFLAGAHQMASSSWFSGAWTPLFSQRGTNNLHEIIFAGQIKALSFGPGALRITQVGIALAGATLVVAAVYDLAGLRAAKLIAWLAAIEPSSVFFSGTLLKEPLLELAIGLIVLGGVRAWRHLDLPGVVLITVGCVVATFDRGYVGFFLIGGAVLLLFHASARNALGRARAIPIALSLLVGVFLISPTVLRATSDAQLQTQLQGSQNANTLVTPSPSDAANVGKPNGNNLALEPVDFSSRTAVVVHLPQRIRDLLLKPYPWQLGDWSQRLGAVGGLIVLAMLILFIRYAWRSRGVFLGRTAPLLYPFLATLLAYSLSVGNAGTGFRYRAHLIIPMLGMIAILWVAARAEAEATISDRPGLAPRGRARRQPGAVPGRGLGQLPPASAG